LQINVLARREENIEFAIRRKGMRLGQEQVRFFRTNLTDKARLRYARQGREQQWLQVKNIFTKTRSFQMTPRAVNRMKDLLRRRSPNLTEAELDV
jgi:hypothetical protein